MLASWWLLRSSWICSLLSGWNLFLYQMISHPWMDRLRCMMKLKPKHLKSYIWESFHLHIEHTMQYIKFFSQLALLLLQLSGQSGLSKYLTLMETNFSGRTTSGLVVEPTSSTCIVSSCRRVVDAITGTEEAAYKSLGEKERQTVVRNVLKWEGDGDDDTLRKGEVPSKSFDLCSSRETDLNRTGQISLAEFKQMVVRYALERLFLCFSRKDSVEPVSGKTCRLIQLIRSPDFVNNFRIRL